MPGRRTSAVVGAWCEMTESMCSLERYGEEDDGGVMVTKADGGRLWCASWERAAYYHMLADLRGRGGP